MAKKVKGNCTQSQPKKKNYMTLLLELLTKNYGITWKDCVRLLIGGIETVNVYMSKTDKPKLAKYFWNELNAETTGTAVAPVASFLVSRNLSSYAQNATSVLTVLLAESLKTASLELSIMKYRKIL